MKVIIKLASVMLIVVLLINLTGCYGSFALTKKLYNWNGSLGDKWINTAVMWVFMILPVYQAAGFIDFVVLNTIQFWTGDNPVAMNYGDQKIKYASHDGKTYKITITKNNVNILETAGPDKGKALTLCYSPETGNWTMAADNSIATVANVSGSNLKLYYPNGETRNIQLAR